VLSDTELDNIFDELKRIMEEYAPPFSVKTPSEALKKKRSFELTSHTKVVIAGRPRDEVYFAGLIKQKGYVGFYYMPAYAFPEVTTQLSPKFMSLLKGKTCFSIKSTEPPLLAEVRKALDLASKVYAEQGWV
jgi:hypothetical protein